MRVLGRELCGASRRELVATRREIGFIFQAHNLFGSLTAMQNVRMGLELFRFSQHGDETAGDDPARAVGLGTSVALQAGLAFGRPEATRGHRSGTGSRTANRVGGRTNRRTRRAIRPGSGDALSGTRPRAGRDDCHGHSRQSRSLTSPTGSSTWSMGASSRTWSSRNLL